MTVRSDASGSSTLLLAEGQWTPTRRRRADGDEDATHSPTPSRQRKSGDLTGDGDALVTRLGIDLPKSEPRPQSFKQRREEANEQDDPEMHPGVHAARMQSFKKKKTREGESVDVAAAS